MTIENEMTQEALTKIEQITGGKLTFGKLLWAIRKCDELSQVEFAKKLGISKQHLCDLEHERKGIRPKLAAIYAKKLGYSEEQFVRLALQDMLDREGLKIIIEIKPMELMQIKHKRQSFVHV